jgi:hypothetical protein
VDVVSRTCVDIEAPSGLQCAFSFERSINILVWSPSLFTNGKRSYSELKSHVEAQCYSLTRHLRRARAPRVHQSVTSVS